MKRVTVQIPATSANLGPGFDILGIALRRFNDVSFETDAWYSGSAKLAPSLTIDIEGEGAHQLKRDDSNLVIKAAYRVFDHAKIWPGPLKVKMVNRIFLSRGLGSSAAATLGGMVAANTLVGKPLSDETLLDLAVRMEGHPDNIVPAFAGGLCVSGFIDDQVRYFKMPAPKGLQAVVCSPDRPLPTSQARRVLASRIPFSAAVFTASRLGFLLGAFLNRKYDWLSFAMEDVLHQPARARLVPGLLEAIKAAKEAGAYGSALSGAGSSVIAFVKPGSTGAHVGAAFEKVFATHGVSSRWSVLPIEDQGVRVSVETVRGDKEPKRKSK